MGASRIRVGASGGEWRLGEPRRPTVKPRRDETQRGEGTQRRDREGRGCEGARDEIAWPGLGVNWGEDRVTRNGGETDGETFDDFSFSQDRFTERG